MVANIIKLIIHSTKKKENKRPNPFQKRFQQFYGAKKIILLHSAMLHGGHENDQVMGNALNCIYLLYLRLLNKSCSFNFIKQANLPL